MSDAWLIPVYWSSCLFRFLAVVCVELSVTSFGTLKYVYVIKTREMFSLLPLISSSVTMRPAF